MSLLAWLGALVIGVTLGLLGSGGSILTVPVLVFVVGQGEKVAIAGSLGIVGLIALAGALPPAFGGQVRWPSVVWFGLPSMVGAWLGAALSGYVSGTTQMILFAVVMLLAAALMLRRPAANQDSQTSRSRPVPLVMLDGLLVGSLAGVVGVGGGFLIVPALVLLGGMSMRSAVPTSLMVIAMQSAAGFVGQLAVLDSRGLEIDWQVFAAFSGVGVAGAFAGMRVGARIDQTKLRFGFALMLLVMAGVMLWQTSSAADFS